VVGVYRHTHGEIKTDGILTVAVNDIEDDSR